MHYRYIYISLTQDIIQIKAGKIANYICTGILLKYTYPLNIKVNEVMVLLIYRRFHTCRPSKTRIMCNVRILIFVRHLCP